MDEGIFEERAVNINSSSENKTWFTMRKSQRALMMGIFVGLLIGGGAIFTTITLLLSNFSNPNIFGVVGIILGVLILLLNWDILNPPRSSRKGH